MKLLIVFAAILATVSCQANYRPQIPEYAPIPYSFNYLSEAEDGSSSHQETGDGAGNVQGSYTLLGLDGLKRVVEYTAGSDGFKAIVRTNEPGTDNSSPANVVFESTAPGATGPIIKYSNDASPAVRTTTRGQRQNVRYVLVPSTDPRATRQ
ncbi:uncharacterized protein CEXT_789631 [Caerostris extrusa]|uniref:Uncharacterized protein n=1 Tax=Caerostris extrusa TaxID=172846 RepID=A0AAV4PTT4_CAEEX|nr:uncharacterized protein CEXT_789631 [Caerostris extrusa]